MGRIYEATWGRAFAAMYDRSLAATEEAGLRAMRRELLAEAEGRTVDIGAGTGANLGLYGPRVTELTLVEPGSHMARRLRARVAQERLAADVVEAPAENLPFPDASVDTTVFTLVLCTVGDQGAALAEAARVLRPGGRMLFCEHVRSGDPGRARWQDRLERPWHFLAAGCHPNRDTAAAIRASALEIESLDEGRMPKAPPIARPLIRGVARRPA